MLSMEKQSGFPTRRTDSSDLSTRLTATSNLPRTPEKTKWQRRYDTRHYNPKDKYELKKGQRTLNTRCHYYNR